MTIAGNTCKCGSTSTPSVKVVRGNDLIIEAKASLWSEESQSYEAYSLDGAAELKMSLVGDYGRVKCEGVETDGATARGKVCGRALGKGVYGVELTFGDGEGSHGRIYEAGVLEVVESGQEATVVSTAEGEGVPFTVEVDMTVRTVRIGKVAATDSYETLTDKPSIEGKTISGAMTLSDFGAAKKSDLPTMLSQLTDDIYAKPCRIDTSKCTRLTWEAEPNNMFSPVYAEWDGTNVKSEVNTYMDSCSQGRIGILNYNGCDFTSGSARWMIISPMLKGRYVNNFYGIGLGGELFSVKFNGFGTSSPRIIIKKVKKFLGDDEIAAGAYEDGQGNLITETYETKENAGEVCDGLQEQIMDNADSIGSLTNAVNKQGETIASIRDRVSTNERSISTLNSDSNTEGSVKKTVADAIALIVAGAPTDFDTLKEIADYIASDKTGAAQMSAALSQLQSLTKTHTDEIVANTADIATNKDNIADNASNIEVLQKFVDNNQMLVEYDEDSGEVYIGVGSWNTTFDSGEIDEETGEVVLNVAS